MFADQFTDVMILVLLAAAVISGLIGEAKDTLAIIVIVVLNAVIGFIQEYRADRAMEALKAMAAPTATVLRAGAIALAPSIGAGTRGYRLSRGREHRPRRPPTPRLRAPAGG